MNTKLAAMVAALALGLGGCASDPGMGGMVYRDGGYYAPARDGYGDYYLAPDYSDDWAYDGYYDPFYDPFYGPFYDPFVFGPNWYGGGGGYCSVRYRYCPAGWYDGFGSGYYGFVPFGTGLWLSFGGRGGYYDPWGYRDQPYAWRPPHHPQPTPAPGAQSPPWRPPAEAGDGLADAGSRDGFAAETDADGHFADGNGDGRPDERPLRRRLLRQQPMGTPIPLGSRPPPPNPAWLDRFGQTDRGGRGAGGDERRSSGGERSSGGRSDGAERASASDDSDQTPRARRRDRGE